MATEQFPYFSGVRQCFLNLCTIVLLVEMTARCISLQGVIYCVNVCSTKRFVSPGMISLCSVIINECKFNPVGKLVLRYTNEQRRMKYICFEKEFSQFTSKTIHFEAYEGYDKADRIVPIMH